MIRNYLIVGDFASRLKFYLRAIKRVRARSKSVIILVPDLSLTGYFTKYLREPYVLLSSAMSKTQRWLAWDRLRRGEVQIVIGSQSALFAPTKSLGLVIIDQEENETYKNDRSPRFHAVRVAKKLAEISKANLFLGSAVPQIETYFNAIEDKEKILTHQAVVDELATMVIDMSSEKYIISDRLEEEIGLALKNKKRVLLVLNRKGEGSKFSCVDCGWIALCEKCGLPLVPQKTENICFRCEKKYPPIDTCPKCKSVHLKPMGLGTARVKKFLSDLFPGAKITQIEKDLDDQNIFSGWDIALATNYALKFPLPRTALVALLDADQGLNFPDFSVTEKNFATSFKFLKIAPKKIIQTHLPESNFIRHLAKMDYKGFFLDEIETRKKFSFPPFSRLVRLEFRHEDLVRAKTESQKVYELLKSQLNITPPYPPFINRSRNKFRLQMLVKYQKGIPEKVKNILKSLPAGWIVDVDPISLL